MEDNNIAEVLIVCGVGWSLPVEHSAVRDGGQAVDPRLGKASSGCAQ